MFESYLLDLLKSLFLTILALFLNAFYHNEFIVRFYFISSTTKMIIWKFKVVLQIWYREWIEIFETLKHSKVYKKYKNH